MNGINSMLRDWDDDYNPTDDFASMQPGWTY